MSDTVLLDAVTADARPSPTDTSVLAPLPTISVVVPVYNSEDTLAELVDRLVGVLSRVADRFEIILVNDGSRDSSGSIIRALAARCRCVSGIELMRNYGQHNALLAGIRAARYDVIVTLDDDLQHPPEEIPKLLAKLGEGYDVVYGAPESEQHGFWRNALSQVTKRALARAMRIPAVRDISAFRAFSSRMRRAFETYQSPHVLLDVLLSWGTTRFAAVTVDRRPRRIGRSNYTLLALVRQAVLLLTGFSTLPLRLASLSGFGFTVFGIFLLLYVVSQYYSHGSMPGFPFLASVVTLFAGAQLFALGLIGEYLARMYDRSLERPTYVVGGVIPSESVDGETADD